MLYSVSQAAKVDGSKSRVFHRFSTGPLIRNADQSQNLTGSSSTGVLARGGGGYPSQVRRVKSSTFEIMYCAERIQSVDLTVLGSYHF
jgi:hypothetical protein